MSDFLYSFNQYLKNNNRWIFNSILVLATIVGGILGVPDIPGWIFLIVICLLIIFIHYSFCLLNKPNESYHYQKKIEEAHIRYEIPIEEIFKKDKEKKTDLLAINAKSKHRYIVSPLNKSLSIVHHEFKVFDYKFINYAYQDQEAFIKSIESNYDNTKLDMLEFSDNMLKFRLEFTPSIKPPKEIEYTFSRKIKNAMFLSQEDLFETISKGLLPPTRPFCFKSIKADVPTKLIRLKVEFPNWYKVKSVLPLVIFNGEIIKNIQNSLKIKYNDEFETYTYMLEVPEKLIFIGFYYSISWLPPKINELKQILK